MLESKYQFHRKIFTGEFIMPSRFEFLEDQFPKLFDYGRKAEECISTDPNICLLNLGRIAENITDNLCRKNNIPGDSEKVYELTSRGLITDQIAQKINALTEIKHEAANDDYDSEMACSRLMVAAEELCMWFVNEGEEGRFSFLADLYPPDKPAPVLMNLSVLGREAEENLSSNTRYCFICLGDIGEAVVVSLITGNGINIRERDQIDRIDMLSEKHIIPDDMKTILHDLRMARNKALHERYNDDYTSESEGRRLLDGALSLCEWIFRLTMKAGYVVKAVVTGETEGGYSAVMGRIPAFIPESEIPEGKTCIPGKKYVLKISDAESDPALLSMSDAERDYNLSAGRLYAKYRIGQKVKARIKSVSKSTGVIVELKDGLEARIPPSELAGKISHYDPDSKQRLTRYDITARIKWFSLTQYPPMILSVRDIHAGRVKPQTTGTKSPMSDIDFYTLCREARYEKIIEALDNEANPNAKNTNGTTALMAAAEHTKDARVIRALVEAGADVNARNRKGNTPLIFAAMRNNPEAVRILYEAGADIDAVNSEGKKAADYAVTNRKLNGTEILKRLKGESPIDSEIPKTESTTETETHETESPAEISQPQSRIDNHESEPQIASESPENESQAETETPETVSPAETGQTSSNDDEPEIYEYEAPETPTKEEEEALSAHREELQREFLRICRSGSEDEIAEAVSAGVNVNVTNKAEATALMFAAKDNTAGAVEILIHAGAAVNAQDRSGNTALIYAASYNTDDVVSTLIDAGADKDIMNLSGHRASDYAAKNYRLDDTEAVKKL